MDLKCIFLLLLVYKDKYFLLIESKERGEVCTTLFPFPSLLDSK